MTNEYVFKNHCEIRWSKDDINSLVRMYKEGILTKEIAKSINRTNDAIKGKIIELGIKNRFIQWTDEDIEKLKLLRKQGNTFGQIAKILGKTERAAQGKHARLFQPVKNIKKKSYKQRERRLYSAKDDYFTIIDTQKKAYYLGFILTDGYVITSVNSKGRNRYKLNRLGMHLAEKDIDVLYDLKKELCSQVPIRMIKSKPIKFREQIIRAGRSCSLHITSKQIIEDLATYGIVQNKTYTCTFPEKLDKKYYPGFIAGVLSGDGSVGTRTNHGRNILTLRSSFAGTKPLMDSIRNILIENIGYNPQKKPRKHKQTFNLYGIELNKKETLNMYYWMKDNSTSLMPRKNKIIEDYIRDYPEKCNLKKVG